MADNSLRYYILFANYEQGLALHELLDNAGVTNRIAPAPRSIQGDLSCGMSLLVEEEHIEAVRACIEKHQATHHSIVEMENQIQPNRNRFC